MRHTTGVDTLDRRLQGGIPAGDVVAFTAPADTQAELLLESLACERETVFVSTLRTAAEAKRTLVDAGADLGGLRVSRASPDELLSNPGRFVDRIPDRSNLIVEGVGALETADRESYLAFLDAVKSSVSNTESAGVLFAIDREDDPERRSLTLHRADHVWRLYQELTNKGLRTTFSVPKRRGGAALRDPIQVRLTDEVEVDTSRDIA
jgi:KaiC/GvpD/RAD55 family RecA-like ATPase